MGPFLGLWFVYCLVVSICVGLMTWYIVGPGQPFSYVFHIVLVFGFFALWRRAAAAVDLVSAQLGYDGEIAD